MRRVKLAILGTGDVAGRDYLPEMGRLADRAIVVAVCDRTGVRGRAVADQYRRDVVQRLQPDAGPMATPTR